MRKKPMDKVIKCVLLDVDNVLITEVIEIVADIGEPNCKLVNPYQFLGLDDMKPWPKVTNQKEIMISSDRILTIADPTPEVIEKYLELTA
jgi:hypothetical protein